MTVKAIGRLALIALTGTFVATAVPASAACTGDSCRSGAAAKPVILKDFAKKKIRIAYHRHHYHQVASRHTADADRDVAKVDTLSADVADARAQMTADDIKAKPVADKPSADQAAAAQAVDAKSAPADSSDASVQVVNADELNDIDKAATDGVASLPKLSAAVANSHAEMRDDKPSTWAQTSTIGKAFIAFGVMLTLASAARMFMA